MKQFVTLFMLLFGLTVFGQLKGSIKDTEGKPISYTTVYLEKSQQNTISNEQGLYELSLPQKGEYTVVYQFLGYKTLRKNITYTGVAQEVNVVLESEDFILEDIVITAGKNPADDLIRLAIKNKQKNTEGMSAFTADFYSKGMLKTLKMSKFFQKKVQVNGSGLSGADSLGRGIVYLSETVSSLKYQKPNKLKEHIIASKVSGSNSGYSFNTADESFYDFYDNHIVIGDMDTKLISPIADVAFSYYKYTLEATFRDQGVLINKIKVTPKSSVQPVFSGDLYLVDGIGAIYGIDLKVTGVSVQQPLIEEINVSQNFSYNEDNKSWVKRSQNLDLVFGALGVRIQAVFLSVFNNYNFTPNFTRASFDKEILSFAKDVNKKGDDFWKENRLFALSEEELNDYRVKDSIRIIKESPAYKDSIRKKHNRFKIGDVFGGYNYRGEDNMYSIGYTGLIGMDKPGFNTVQGFNMKTDVYGSIYDKDKIGYTYGKASFGYGFASDRLRVYGKLLRQFKGASKSAIYIEGGSKIEQYNKENIPELLNTAFSLLMRKNYAKYYNHNDVYVGYYGQFFNEALKVHSAIGYEDRSPLYNNANGSFYKGSRAYTSNDPLAPLDMNSSPITNHHLYKFRVGTTLSLGMNYVSYPDKRIYMRNPNYPLIEVNYEKGFSGSEKGLEYDKLEARFSQGLTVSNKGRFEYNVLMGKYFGADGISYVDRKHFTGNETHLNITNDRLTSFNLLPYYALSTNKSYVESHFEYDFKGFLINKVPLLRETGWNVVLGYHNAMVSDIKPYHEFTAGLSNFGFGKINFFRIDYVRSYQGGAFAKDGIMIGVKKNF
ncbi:DUF5686 and carboxypeptidase regulatory-like domain-containing protein [Myroides odoratimimus]|uniref:DUF5686 and carboxypeptidase regulatory-like domain-containing protein n=1 Tax=Myroides odoratimimus TaxID=76832 RepID=UPI001CE0C2D1|nr:DUF5686 and carboxypeptidase regulatory-like domain-containing protein [Myroides odoratimimus]MCA4791239.1 carboxypeptidase-like regulatory domain-containing protein [Myroides odoratimimus]MCA4818499.1 carboxypeptidase-like regulatory domain-containing protein [Myroides odoratimimus]MDM1453793.1 carboxypeptidase-like regulatory domain-containing protein [Myroides odoratimimus]MDM1477547.1 carboxypeptidase-like regulatory domain-containing protein [Myroides odoratimimus]MDM1489826.1 carboxyp